MKVPVSNNPRINPVNDPPKRVDQGAREVYLIEDGGSTSLGLQNMAWTTGAEVKIGDEEPTQIDNEAAQILTFKIKKYQPLNRAKSPMNEQSRRTMSVDEVVTEEQLKSAEFSPTSNFNGKVSFSYKAIDAHPRGC